MLTKIFNPSKLFILAGVTSILCGCNAGTTNTSNALLSLSMTSPINIGQTVSPQATLSNITVSSGSASYTVTFSQSSNNLLSFNAASCIITIPAGATSGSCSIQATGRTSGQGTIQVQAIGQTVNQTFNVN